MFKMMKRISRAAGFVPGAPVHIGDRKDQKVKITLIDYNEKELQEREISAIEECFSFKDKPSVTWINIDGIHDVSIIEKIGQGFNLHPLILEDILNTEQRPKMVDFGDYLFIILKMLYNEPEEDEIKAEHISLILGSNFVISFQETEGDVFDNVRERIRNAKGRVRKMGPDYLAYALIDAIVDHYFVILEELGEEIEVMEDELIKDPCPKNLQLVHYLKSNTIFLRKSVWPLREVVSGLERSGSALIKKPTLVFLRNLYDHTIQVIDTIETYRDIISSMVDIYLSSLNYRLNEVMKVLTVIATIFMPLTFITGIYGMNFKYLPELNWRWGYLWFWSFIVIVALLMILHFRRRKWL
jgi:magnesium transporter